MAADRRRRCARPVPWGTGLILVPLLVLAACSASRLPVGPATGEARLEDGRVITADGAILPLRSWRPDPARGVPPAAVLVALHGFNDYSKAFDAPASWWAERGIVTYAYDQRGFGGTEHRGLWAGSEILVEDLRTVTALVAEEHPGVPVHVLGVSMGGAVALVAMAGESPPAAAGVILSGPAVWSREAMPALQRGLLWLAARTVPWARFSGGGLKIQASDNIAALRDLGRDPAVIKKTRVDAIDGLTDLMTEALEAAPRLTAPALLLYGEKDEIVPRDPSLRLWRDLPDHARTRQRAGLYADGWHLLLRDLQADVVRRDIAAWIGDPAAALPSGADGHARAALAAAGETERASDDEAPADRGIYAPGSLR